MKFLFKIFASIYQVYNTNYRTNDIPYFSTLATLIFLLMLTLFQVGLILNVSSDYFMPWKIGESKGVSYLKGIIAIIMLSGILSIVFKKKIIENIHVDKEHILKTRTYIICYFVVMMAMLFILVFKRKVLHLQ